jgi:hypothetical protein
VILKGVSYIISCGSENPFWAGKLLQTFELNIICGVRPVVLNKAVGEPEAEKRCHKVYFGTGWHDTLVCFFIGSCFVWSCSHVLAVMSYTWQ